MGGRDKLLEPVRGKPILRQTAIAALKADLGPVIVGLRPMDHARRKALRNLDVTIIEIEDAENGMSATLRQGARAARLAIDGAYPAGGDHEYFGMLVLLPDMPGIDTDDLTRMDRAFQSSGGSFVRATTVDGQPGHPVIFPDHALEAFERLEGDTGAAPILRGERVCEVPLSGNRARLDLDTPEDWADWRSAD